MSIYYLYRITNNTSGREYVGVTNNYERRMAEHFVHTHTNSSVAPDIKALGRENFSKEVLCIGTKDYILDLEFAYLDKYLISNNMYNKNRGGALNGGTFGENHGSTELSDSDVINIRRLYSLDNNLSYGRLAAIYGITEASIGKIIRHATWKHIPDYPYVHRGVERKGVPRDTITFSDAELIRELYATGLYTYSNISDILDNIISKTAVGKIIRGERWR